MQERPFNPDRSCLICGFDESGTIRDMRRGGQVFDGVFSYSKRDKKLGEYGRYSGFNWALDRIRRESRLGFGDYRFAILDDPRFAYGMNPFLIFVAPKLINDFISKEEESFNSMLINFDGPIPPWTEDFYRVQFGNNVYVKGFPKQDRNAHSPKIVMMAHALGNSIFTRKDLSLAIPEKRVEGFDRSYFIEQRFHVREAIAKHHSNTFKPQ